VKKRYAAAFALLLSSCAGNPQQLPVGVSICNAVATPQGFNIVANVENKSDRPITGLGLTTAFYQDFRYRSYSGSAHLKQELDPGQKRDITFDIGAPKTLSHGQAIRCFITHIGYMDGTSADAPRPQ
jgi:hypothetical protein